MKNNNDSKGKNGIKIAIGTLIVGVCIGGVMLASGTINADDKIVLDETETAQETTEELTVRPIVTTTELPTRAKEDTNNTEKESEKATATLDQNIQQDTTQAYIKNEDNIPKVVKIDDPMTTTTIEQTTEATTQAATTITEQTTEAPTTVTEKQTQATTKVPTTVTEKQTQAPTNNNTVNNPQMGDTDGKGNIYVDGFGWVKDEGGGTNIEEANFEITGNKIGH